MYLKYVCIMLSYHTIIHYIQTHLHIYVLDKNTMQLYFLVLLNSIRHCLFVYLILFIKMQGFMDNNCEQRKQQLFFVNAVTILTGQVKI